MVDSQVGTGTNQLVTFATGIGANVESPADWLADAIRDSGFQPGKASSTKFNTACRQAEFIMSMIAQFAADFSERASLDDGDVLQEEQNFIDALRKLFKDIYFCVDTGTANAMIGTPYPAAKAYDEKMLIIVKKCPSSNTGAMTARFWDLQTVSLTDNTAAALSDGALIANSYYILTYTGAGFRVLGGVAEYVSITNLTVADGDMVDVATNHVINWRTLFGTADNTIGDLDRWPRGEDISDQAQYVTSLEFIQWIIDHIPRASGILGMKCITESGTYTKTLYTKYALVIATGGGAGGSTASSCAGGGGAGGTSIAFVDLSNINTVACTIGAGGIGAVTSKDFGLAIGGNGGETSFGTYAVAGGGKAPAGVAGSSGSGSNIIDNGGAGGDATVGTMLITGGSGDCSHETSPYSSGTGGTSFWGGGGAGSRGTADAGNGHQAYCYGSGGGGAESDAPFTGKRGGNGMSGVILVIEFGEGH